MHSRSQYQQQQQQSSYDLTEDEEGRLPLPPNWSRRISTLSDKISYSNDLTGQKQNDHPFLLQALVKARNIKLSSDWVVQSSNSKNLESGNSNKVEYYYVNSIENLCGWDPPHLRNCLSEILAKNNFYKESREILLHDFSTSSAKSNINETGEILFKKYNRNQVTKEPTNHIVITKVDEGGPIESSLGGIPSNPSTSRPTREKNGPRSSKLGLLIEQKTVTDNYEVIYVFAYNRLIKLLLINIESATSC